MQGMQGIQNMVIFIRAVLTKNICLQFGSRPWKDSLKEIDDSPGCTHHLAMHNSMVESPWKKDTTDEESILK